MTEVAGPEGPAVFAHGTFVIYEDGAGGYMLVTDSPELGGVTRRHIHRGMIKAASMLGGKLGGLGAMLGG